MFAFRSDLCVSLPCVVRAKYIYIYIYIYQASARSGRQWSGATSI